MPSNEDFQLSVLKWIEKNGIKDFSLEFNLYVKDVFQDVINCFQDSDFSLKEQGTIKRPSYKTPVVIEILYFIIKNDKSLLKNLSITDKNFLSRLDHDEKVPFSEIIDWFNAYGDNILDNIYNLSRTDKIPENLRVRIFDETLIGQYTPLAVCEDIERNLTKQTNYLLSYSSDGYDKNIEISINTRNKQELSQAYLDKLMRTILVLPKLNLDRVKDTPVKLSLYFSQVKKKCNGKKEKILGSNNINSGVSVFKFNESLPILTTVFRGEEMNKLIIHELIHTFKYDFEFMDFNLKLSEFLNISRDTKLTPNESYTEVVTVIINAMIESYNFKNTENYDMFKVMLNYEAQFSLLQCARILKFYEFTSVDDFFQKYDNRNRFRQNTNVFSYFFIKTAVLVNLGDLLDFFERYSNNFFLKKGNTYYIKSEYENLIIKSLKKSAFKKGIEHFYKKLDLKGSNMKNAFDSPKELCKTLRMTIFG